jgi:5'-3' exoribonuclease 1
MKVPLPTPPPHPAPPPKMQTDYDANTRHCVLGNDADLIMLSLSTHEPHFALLREKVDFAPPRRNRDGTFQKPTRAETEQKKRSKSFELLFIGILREYLDVEFRIAAGLDPVPVVGARVAAPKWRGAIFDAERVIDDFIIFCFLVGNDFLPHLPSLDIANGGLDALVTSYKALMTDGGGYLLHDGAGVLGMH